MGLGSSWLLAPSAKLQKPKVEAGRTGRDLGRIHGQGLEPHVTFTAAPQSLPDPPCLCRESVLLTALSQPPAFPQLTSKATLSEYIQTIPLPKSGSDLPTGTKCMIAGWGLIDEDKATNKLFETKVSIYSRRKCILFYPHLDSGMVCAGSFHQLKDSSQVWGSLGAGAAAGMGTVRSQGR